MRGRAPIEKASRRALLSRKAGGRSAFIYNNITMTPLILDIETAGRADSAEFLPPIEAPSNYKDAAKIEAYLTERRAKQLEAAALSAETGRVLAVGLLRDGHNPQVIHDDNETALLRQTWIELGNRAGDATLVTFCGHRFDLPYLARRSFALGVTIPAWFPKDGRFRPPLYCDLAELWQCGDRAETISLDRLAKLCGLPGKTGSGADFAMLWQSDRTAALAYLGNDLRLTLALWQRMAGSPFSDSSAVA